MAKKNDNSDTADLLLGCVGFLVLGIMGIGIVIAVVAIVPLVGWVGKLVIAVGVLALLGVVVAVATAPTWAKQRKNNARKVKQQREDNARKVEQQQEDNARRFKQRRIEILGMNNAALVSSAEAAVGQIVASEAARAGWLGDVDFTADLKAVIDNLRNARDLREVADRLSGLDAPIIFSFTRYRVAMRYLADADGWVVRQPSPLVDQFERGGVVIRAHYSPGDLLRSAEMMVPGQSVVRTPSRKAMFVLQEWVTGIPDPKYMRYMPMPKEQVVKYESGKGLAEVSRSDLYMIDELGLATRKLSAEDRKILAEAKTTAANLERAAVERVDLIHQCEIEARLVDESLHKERDDARTAKQRAELHAKLSGMLYGIAANSAATQTDSAADAVMARVQAYREIKNQIHCARDDQL